MRVFKRLTVAVAGAGLLLAPLLGTTAASASTRAPAGHGASVWVKGGTTTVTTAPGIALTLIENGIVPVGVAPGTEQLALVHGSATARFAFPVTGGKRARSVRRMSIQVGEALIAPPPG